MRRSLDRCLCGARRFLRRVRRDGFGKSLMAKADQSPACAALCVDQCVALERAEEAPHPRLAPAEGGTEGACARAEPAAVERGLVHDVAVGREPAERRDDLSERIERASQFPGVPTFRGAPVQSPR